MTKQQIMLMSLIGAAALAVLWLGLRNPEPPLLPDDDEHAGFARAENCFVCHGPNGSNPRNPSHPIGRECTRCHGRR